jgi:serine/threonine protein kinase
MVLSDEARQRIGRYEVVKTIGKGAMGIVYKARDPLLDRIVAVKTIMSPQGQGKRVRSAFLERFQREAKAAAKMQHPAIVTIFDVGVDDDTGAPFMVLEYLPGESLADRLDRVRLPLSRCVTTSLDLASALAFAHRQRIVHRDVKPANVLHAGDNRWKLADFGIARMPDSDLTQVGIFMGTPGYSPPEAIREGRYTPQADVFAWGAVLYELLSGRIPYEGPDTKTTNSYVVSGNAAPPTRHDPSIPEPISNVVMTAIQPSATARYKDGSDAEAALREAWERCLTQGIIQPAVLAMEETPHDKVPPRMHEVRGPRPPPPPTPGSRPDDRFVIESSSDRERIGDDDPTRLVVRDGDKGKGDATVRGMGSGPRTSQKPAATDAEPTLDDALGSMSADQTPTPKPGPAPKPSAKVKKESKPGPMIGRSIAERGTPGGNRILLIVLIALLAIAGTVAALYYGGVIK